MLVSIRRLGEFVKLGGEPIKAADILSIQFIKKGEDLCYDGVELEERKGEERYLYYRDKSGKPGLFLSWRISSGSVRGLKRAVKENNTKEVEKFEKDKVKWLAYPPLEENEWPQSKLKILRDFPPAKEEKLLRQILHAYAENSDKICCDLKEKISAMERSPELLVTIKIIKDDEELYPGDCKELVKLLEEYLYR